MDHWIPMLILASQESNLVKEEDIVRLTQYVRQYETQCGELPETIYLWIQTHSNEPNARELSQQIQIKLRDQIPHLYDRVIAHPIERKPTLEEFIDEMTPFVHRMSIQHPFDTFGQIVTGLEPPMLSRALFLEGIKHWEERYASVYASPERLISVPTANTLSGGDWLSVLRHFILDGDYQAAALWVKDRLQSDPSHVNAVKWNAAHSIFCMLNDRLNFAFPQAAADWHKARSLLPPGSLIDETDDVLRKLQGTAGEQETDLERIVELYRQLDLWLETDDVPSFFIRFYRAREAVLQYICRYGGDYPIIGKPFSPLHDRLELMEEAYATGILKRFVGAFFYCKSKNVTDTLQLRNHSIVGHGRKGFSNRRIWTEYTGYAGHPIHKSKVKFERDTRLLLQDLGGHYDDHYGKWNSWILRWLAEDTQLPQHSPPYSIALPDANKDTGAGIAQQLDYVHKLVKELPVHHTSDVHLILNGDNPVLTHMFNHAYLQRFGERLHFIEKIDGGLSTALDMELYLQQEQSYHIVEI